MDYSAKIEQKKKLLVAAGINEYDAHHVATELTDSAAVAIAGGPGGGVVANGQGSKSRESLPPSGMYGTQFRSDSTLREKRTSDSSESSFARPQRPATRPSVSYPGRLSYLGSRGVAPRSGVQDFALRPDTRLESPAMTTNEELYAPLQYGADVPLGGDVLESRPVQRMNRTASSFA
jgi:aquaporin related protein